MRWITAQVVGVGGAERMVQGFISVFIAVELEHWKVNDPEEVLGVVLPVGFHQVEFLRQVLPLSSDVPTPPVAARIRRRGPGGSPGLWKAHLKESPSVATS